MNSEESVFVRKALEDVEKAQKYQRVKQIAATTLLGVTLVWVAFQPPFGAGQNGAYTVIMVNAVALAVCTAKIKSLMNKNTTAVLRAIADLQRR